MDSQIIDYLLGSGGAAGLTLLLILTGVLVPRTFYKKALEENKKKDATIDLLQAANLTLRDVNSNLASSGKLTNQVVTALMTIATEHRKPDDPIAKAIANDLLQPGE